MIVILSDSHGERQVIENIKAEYLSKASAIFHCGDSELPAADPIWDGVTVVAGNCDYDPDYQDRIIKEVEGKRVLLTHGHLQAINIYGLTDLSYLAEEKQADLIFFGHIHRPVAELAGKRLYINPGSVSQPRGEWDIKMYATLEIVTTEEGNTLYQLAYHTLDHQIIPELRFEFEVKNSR